MSLEADPPRCRLHGAVEHILALLTANGGSSASSVPKVKEALAGSAVAALNFRSPRQAAQGGAMDAFRVEALPRRREYEAVRSRRAARRVSTLPCCGPGSAGIRVKPLVLLVGPAGR